MPVEFLLKGIGIGLLFGMPIGAVGAMTVRRTLNYGPGAGFLTGFGSSAADCLYACVGAFGLRFISDFLILYQVPISLLGGCLLIGMGVRMIRRKTVSTPKELHAQNNVKTFLSSFVIGITNPATILTFLFAFSYFGITGKAELLQGVQLVCGVLIGTCMWWGILSAGVNLFKKKVKNLDYSKANRLFGLVLALFGLSVFVKAII